MGKSIGCYFDKSKNKWRVNATLNGVRHFLGDFNLMAEANKTYNDFIKKNNAQITEVKNINLKNISVSELKKILHYNEFNGNFTWLINTANNKYKIGDIAGTLDDVGYIRIGLCSTYARAHRLAWLYMTGEYPSQFIDHIDGIRNNNKFTNLRICTPAENVMNSKLKKTNTSGYKGVSFNKISNTWVARITVNGKRIKLGEFSTPEYASIVFVAYARTYYGDFYSDRINNKTPRQLMGI